MFSEKFFAAWAPRAQAVLRIVTGLLMLEHGTSKLFAFPFQHAAVPIGSLAGAAGSIEVVFGVLLVIGLYSRLAAFILSGEMAFAYFIAHEPRNFFPLLNSGDLAVMFCFACLFLAVSGPGAWSIDGRIGGDPAGRGRLTHGLSNG